MTSPLLSLHIDRRAHRLVDIDLHPDATLSTKEVAEWLGVSQQFLEIARHKGKGHGPKYVRVSDRMIRYRVSDVIAWLKERTHAYTAEYQKRQKRAS
jgi:predicted DNA-binding transcriptional regulator AlpA